MLFIVTANVTHTAPGITSDTVFTGPVTHAVEAECSDVAEAIVHEYYGRQSQPGQPYGDRYVVSDAKAFPPLSLAILDAL